MPDSPPSPTPVRWWSAAHPLLWIGLSWTLFATLYAGASLDERLIYFGGDQAELLRHADDTLRGHPPLVGAQSRGGVYHPGPLFVYMIASVQFLTGHREAWTISIISLVCSTSVLAAQVLTWRLSASTALSVTVPILLALNHLFLLYLRFLWNVTIVFPALAAAFLLFSFLGKPRPWHLPALLAFLALAAQSHMAFVPLSLCIGVLAVMRLQLARALTRRMVMVSLIVAAVAFSPVIWEAVTHRGGNLLALAGRFGSASEPHSWGEVGTALRDLLAETLPGSPAAQTAILLGSLVTLAAAVILQRSAEFRYQALLLVASWSTFVLSLWSIPEPIQTYYLRPVWVLVVATVVSGAAAITSLLAPRRAGAILGALLAATAAVVMVRPAVELRRTFSGASWNRFPLAEMRQVSGAVSGRVLSAGDRQASLRFALGDLAGAEPSILYLLHRSGVEHTHSELATQFLISVETTPPSTDWLRLLRTANYSVFTKPHEGAR